MRWRGVPSTRLLSAAVLTSVALGCNQESYPIAATLCDRWCNVNFNDAPPGYRRSNPAECVVDCEQGRKPHEPQCVALFGSLIDCLEQLPPARASTEFDTTYAATCFDEEQAVFDCIIEHSDSGAPRACIDWCKLNTRLYTCGGPPASISPLNFTVLPIEDCGEMCIQTAYPNEPECAPLFENAVQCVANEPIGQECNPALAELPGASTCAEKLATLRSCEVNASDPADPTPCDNWCNAQQVTCPGNSSFAITKFDRASCVANCNAMALPKKAECLPIFTRLTACLGNPNTACSSDAGSPCADDYAALNACEN